ncbi:MAG TPA: hypothetical protein VK612_13650 [Pyrinomonadaceae bacterium]|nr:hypothetical protein [Pyrinomonadaceae bacterium]
MMVTEGEQIEANLFETKQDPVANTAWACLVYSMVPYLGILFIPFAIAAGSVSFISTRKADRPAARFAKVCIALSLMVFAVQIFLWWLLYFIPKIGI